MRDFTHAGTTTRKDKFCGDVLQRADALVQAFDFATHLLELPRDGTDNNSENFDRSVWGQHLASVPHVLRSPLIAEPRHLFGPTNEPGSAFDVFAQAAAGATLGSFVVEGPEESVDQGRAAKHLAIIHIPEI